MLHSAATCHPVIGLFYFIYLFMYLFIFFGCMIFYFSTNHVDVCKFL